MKRKTRRLTLFIVVMLLLAGAAALAWHLLHPAVPPETSGGTAVVTRRDLAASVSATGAVKAQIGAEVRVGARISGRVEKLRANIGDRVEKGQVLALLERTELEADVLFCRAGLTQAEKQLAAVRNQRPVEIERAAAALADARAATRYARLDWERARLLHEKKAFSLNQLDVARKELDRAEARETLAQAELDLARTRMPDDLRTAEAGVEARRASLAGALSRLEYATIVAPLSGVVASVSTQEGETVAAGLNAPTFLTIIDLERLQVDTFVDEVDIGKIKVGQKAAFTVDSFPSREFAGEVAAIYPKAVIQENVVNYDVVVRITDPSKELLRPEMTASVTIELETRQDVPALPARAVRREKGKSVVYLVQDGKAQPREVRTGWKDSQWVEITSGLREGQTVLLEPPSPARPSGP